MAVSIGPSLYNLRHLLLNLVAFISLFLGTQSTNQALPTPNHPITTLTSRKTTQNETHQKHRTRTQPRSHQTPHLLLIMKIPATPLQNLHINALISPNPKLVLLLHLGDQQVPTKVNDIFRSSLTRTCTVLAS